MSLPEASHTPHCDPAPGPAPAWKPESGPNPGSCREHSEAGARVASLGRGLSTSPGFSSPCQVPDTSFNLLSPGFCEVDESLAGRGFPGCLTLRVPGHRGRGPQRQGPQVLEPAAPPQAHDAPSSEGTPQRLLRAQSSPPTGPDPAWWKTDATPPPCPFPSHLNCSLGRLPGVGERGELGGWACPLPTRSSTPSASSPLGRPGARGLSLQVEKLRSKVERTHSGSRRAPVLGARPSGSQPCGSFIHSPARSLASPTVLPIAAAPCFSSSGHT